MCDEMKKMEGVNWRADETEVFLKLCSEKKIIMLDGKKHKHIDIFKTLEDDMKALGFIKTASQMKIKLKHLKEMYFKCKRNNNRSGSNKDTFQYYELMDELLGSRPSSVVIQNSDTGIDSSLVETVMFEEANIIRKW